MLPVSDLCLVKKESQHSLINFQKKQVELAGFKIEINTRGNRFLINLLITSYQI